MVLSKLGTRLDNVEAKALKTHRHKTRLVGPGGRHGSNTFNHLHWQTVVWSRIEAKRLFSALANHDGLAQSLPEDWFRSLST
jgi:hypothetical protein